MNAGRKQHDARRAIAIEELPIAIAIPIAAFPAPPPPRQPPTARSTLFRHVGCRESGGWYLCAILVVLMGGLGVLLSTSAASLGAYIPLIVAPVAILAFVIMGVWMHVATKRIHRKAAERDEGGVFAFGDHGLYHGGVVGDGWDADFGYGDAGGGGDNGGGGGDSGGGDGGGGGGGGD